MSVFLFVVAGIEKRPVFFFNTMVRHARAASQY